MPPFTDADRHRLAAAAVADHNLDDIATCLADDRPHLWGDANPTQRATLGYVALATLAAGGEAPIEQAVRYCIAAATVTDNSDVYTDAAYILHTVILSRWLRDRQPRS